jgi:glycine cleavage system H protein
MSDTPSDRKYSESHEWYKTDGNIVTVGITKYATEELADITFVDLPSVGDEVDANSQLGEIESVKATSDLYTAVTGKVTEINESLSDAPETVNNDPFGNGWMVKIEATDLSELDKLMDADAYEKTLTSEH